MKLSTKGRYGLKAMFQLSLNQSNGPIPLKNIASKQNISEQYVFVRYMGPKFVIAFSGVEINGVAEYINDLKEKIENTEIVSKDNEKMKAYPRLNFTISTYYKGTGLEEILKKQEEYLDNADINESDITNI